MQTIIPPKLQPGDEVRVVAPSMSLAIINKEQCNIADQRFADMGLRLTFGKHVEDVDDFNSSSISSRIEDLYEAFADTNVKAVLAVTGGFNSNQLFRYIDWDLLRNNPKIFCGYSDTTGIENAIYAKTGLVTYSSPSYSSFGQKLHFDYTLAYFKKCLLSKEPFEIIASTQWSDDDEWKKDQDTRHLIPNKGYFLIQEGNAEGTLIGGNHSLLGLLQGTEYFPSLENSILFLEDDYEIHPMSFDANLQSLIHLPSFSGVKGIVIGRFELKTKMTESLLSQIINTKKELQNMPVIADVDFGHTDPKITFPIGGNVKIQVGKDHSTIEIVEH